MIKLFAFRVEIDNVLKLITGNYIGEQSFVTVPGALNTLYFFEILQTYSEVDGVRKFNMKFKVNGVTKLDEIAESTVMHFNDVNIFSPGTVSRNDIILIADFKFEVVPTGKILHKYFTVYSFQESQSYDLFKFSNF